MNTFKARVKRGLKYSVSAMLSVVLVLAFMEMFFNSIYFFDQTSYKSGITITLFLGVELFYTIVGFILGFSLDLKESFKNNCNS